MTRLLAVIAVGGGLYRVRRLLVRGLTRTTGTWVGTPEPTGSTRV